MGLKRVGEILPLNLSGVAMDTDIQLVHENVLTTEHFVRNLEQGKMTVVLVPVCSREEALTHIRNVTERLRQRLPALVPEFSVYCYGTEQLKNGRRLYNQILNLVDKASPKPPRIIEHRSEWHS